MLVRGREGWRLTGAVLVENRSLGLARAARERASRVVGLLLRLVAGESEQDSKLYALIIGFLEALATLPEESQDAAEVFAALSLLRALGLDAGELPLAAGQFSSASLAEVVRDRTRYVARINEGIAISGL